MPALRISSEQRGLCAGSHDATEIKARFLAEFTLSGRARFFASLRMTANGLRMTAWGERRSTGCLRSGYVDGIRASAGHASP